MRSDCAAAWLSGSASPMTPRSRAQRIVSGELTPITLPANPAFRRASANDPPMSPTPTMVTTFTRLFQLALLLLLPADILQTAHLVHDAREDALQRVRRQRAAVVRSDVAKYRVLAFGFEDRQFERVLHPDDLFHDL